jgi:hypothetical protein
LQKGERLGHAEFKVLLLNVTCPGVPLLPMALWPDSAEPSVALTGVVSESVHKSFGSEWRYSPDREAVTPFVRETGHIPFRIILTHARREEDRALRARLGRRVFLLGGHDHDIHLVEDDGPPLLKNLSNLQTVRVVLILAGGVTVRLQIQDEALLIENDRLTPLRPSPIIPPTELDKWYRDDVDQLLGTLSIHDAQRRAFCPTTRHSHKTALCLDSHLTEPRRHFDGHRLGHLFAFGNGNSSRSGVETGLSNWISAFASL